MNRFIRNIKLFDLVFSFVLFGILIVLSFQFNYKDGKPTGPGVFWSDKSHYYVYLPATFIYGWDVNKFPAHQDKKYQGFILDNEKDKIVIKVTSGVAILAAPFFLVTHGIALISGIPADGFSDFYERMALITPVFYLVLGLFFLKKFLDRYFKSYLSWLTVLIVFSGTNLYYYTLSEGWMSHIFSFFLFSSALYFLKGFLDSGKRSYSKFLLTALAISLAVLVRPTSVILLFLLVLLDVRSFREAWERLLFFLYPRYSVPFALTGILVFLPQFFYWHYLSGSWFFYSYPGETFQFWDRPNLIQVWFAPLNGLFFYNPLVLFMIAGIILMIWKRLPNGWFLGFIFLINSYVIASWHIWYFGGSYGCRPFAEYFALFTLGFAFLFQGILNIRNPFLRSVLILSILVCVFYNQRLISHPRWNTSSTWAWDDFRDYLESSEIQNFYKTSYTLKKDFENFSFEPSEQSTGIHFRSPTKACLIYPGWEFGCGYRHTLGKFLDIPVEKIEVSCWVDPFSSDHCDALMISTIEHTKAGLMMYQSVPFNQRGIKKGQWTKVSTEIPIPLWMNDPEYQFHFYIWNIKKRYLLVDDIRVSFR